MLQDDSNGDTSFEIIDKRSDINSDKTDSLSSISSSAFSIPSPSVVNTPSGNLLSNVAPPMSLPDFTLWSPASATNVTPSIAPPNNVVMSVTQQPTTAALDSKPIPLAATQFPTPQFSAAIPPSKGVPHGPIPTPYAEADVSLGAGLMGFMKEAFASGGVISKMAEKAKNSIITTLDPQMTEYIYSGGETEVLIASDVEEEISAIREAFYTVVGKTCVNGTRLNLPQQTSVTIGFEDGWKKVAEKIDAALKLKSIPTIAIENILFEESDGWYDLNLLILKDLDKKITIKTFSQATPVPLDSYLKQIQIEKPELANLNTAEKLANYLQTKSGWQHSICGLTRREVLLSAAKTLVQIYKNKL